MELSAESNRLQNHAFRCQFHRAAICELKAAATFYSMETRLIERSWTWLDRTLRPTKWSLLKRIRRNGAGLQNPSADEFCRCYWFPLFSYLRHSGYSEADAQDHVQTFLVRVFNEDLLVNADPERGRLRNFLITLLIRHVAARRERDLAKKRGGGVAHVPLESLHHESGGCGADPSSGTPEQSFRRALAVSLVAEGIAGLRRHYLGNGRAELMEELLPALEGPLSDGTYEAAAARLNMRPGAVRMAALRLRERFRLCVVEAAPALLGMPPGPLLDAELHEIFCSSGNHASL